MHKVEESQEEGLAGQAVVEGLHGHVGQQVLCTRQRLHPQLGQQHTDAVVGCNKSAFCVLPLGNKITQHLDTMPRQSIYMSPTYFA